jgi:hypothetical protein
MNMKICSNDKHNENKLNYKICYQKMKKKNPYDDLK